MRKLLVIAAAAWVPAVLLATGPADQNRSATGEEVDFLREVKPILAEKCLACHGPDEPEADLRLDTAAGAFADLGGYAAVVPGNRQDSELWFRITTEDARDRMPPAEHGEPLTPEETEILGRWIDEGAPWQEHWGFADWREVQAPAVQDEDWIRDPIDRFVLARLEQQDLGPAPAAEDLVWLRRVSFDLVGLPPTRAEIDAFLALPEASRREQTVDRLLASPHFGEKWARHHLDLVRYAETRGHEFDFPIPNAFEYRDYLVRAYNQDVGWDQLIREHIAGDLLPDARRHPGNDGNESIIGTGFWYLGEAVHSPVDLEVDLADRSANQLDVFGKAFLGLTIACARCHDHKFDPIPTRDYYSLAGFIQSASYRQVRFESIDHNAAVRERLKALDTEARSQGLDAEARQRWQDAVRLIPALLEQAPALAAEIDAQRDERLLADFEAGLPAGWQAEGTSFATPTWSQDMRPGRYPDPKPVGSGFVNSQQPSDDGKLADAAQGVLRSAPFTIDRDFLLFRVGGGKAVDQVGVQLLIDGESVQRVAGRNQVDLRPVAWDLRRWKGATAQIEIYDRAEGGWGHISCDDFRLQNTVVEIELARQRAGEDGAALLAWVQKPLAGVTSESFAQIELPQVELPREQEGRQLHWLAGDAWWQDGGAWSLHDGGAVLAAERAGLAGWLPFPALVSEPDGSLLEFRPGTTDEATQLNWKGYGRTFRTSTVELGEGPIWYLVRGTGVAFAPVEHHRIINGPLHTGTAHRFDTQGRWQWLRHDVMKRYTGLRAHFEFSPTEGWLAVAAVVQGGEQPPTSLPDWSLAEQLLSRFDLLPVEAQLSQQEADYYAQRAALLAQRRTQSRMAPGLLDGNGVDQPLLFQGNTTMPRDPVPRAMLSRFGGGEVQSADGTPSSGRAELADQLLESAGPLIARVAVNRIWHHLFGKGIAPQPDNFGVLAGYPSHPDLLDALAQDFRAGGWRLKPLVRRIVLSASYGQSGRVDPHALELDPLNQLLHHLPPRRLSAEAVRDALLAASGELDRAMGGPSVPVHLTEFMKGRGRPGRNGPVDGDRRRTIYQEIRRNFLPPFLMIFDYPPPATTMGRRSTSNVPAQSLALMNDPLVRQQAERWAKRLVSSEQPVEEIWWAAFTRAPRPDERQSTQAYLDARIAEGMAREQALAELCHVVFNLKEFVFLP
ncbi:MAG: hypothetical protein CMJ94_00860 [Planctomycetes bacterium]|nr:hypothetical protein [Planctomycetota bacterium]